MELTLKEIEKIKEWSLKFFRAVNIDEQEFDINSEIDNKLSFEENKTQLRKKIKDFINVYQEENLKNLSRSEIEVMPKAQIEVYTTESKKQQEQQAQLEFYNSLEEIGKTKNTGLLEEKFFLLKEYIRMVCFSDISGLIVEGEAGLGKSFNILKTLKEIDKPFIYCSGFATPLEFYNFLYSHKEKVIFFDDTKNLLKNEVSIELLKSALFSPTMIRKVNYMSSTTKLKYPSSFIFEGKIILTINQIPKNMNEDLKAVTDRVLYYNLKFSYEDKLKILADLVKNPYKDLKEEERKYIFEYIKKNTDRSTTNLNFRLLFKLYEIFKYNRNKIVFENLAKGIIRIDEKFELILTCIKENPTIKQAEQQFCEMSGLSRPTFYRLKAKLE